MSAKSKINKYANLSTLARKLRSDLTGIELILLYELAPEKRIPC